MQILPGQPPSQRSQGDRDAMKNTQAMVTAAFGRHSLRLLSHRELTSNSLKVA